MGTAISGQSDWERKLPKSKPKPKKPEGITFRGDMADAFTTVEDAETAPRASLTTHPSAINKCPFGPRKPASSGQIDFCLIVGLTREVEDVETTRGQVFYTSVCIQQVSIWSTEASFQVDKVTFA